MADATRARMTGVQLIEAGDVVFTVSAAGPGELPRPYDYAARCGWLVAAEAPRVLILGLGLGGIAAEMVRRSPGARITGVELDPSSVRWVRRNPIPGVEVVQSEARDYLRRSRVRFDVILDDCFCLVAEDAIRPPDLAEIAGLARRRLAPDGVYVQNTIRDEGGDCALEVDHVFPHRYERGFKEWENVLVVGAPAPLAPERWARFRR